MELACTDCPEKHFADDQLVTQVRTAVESLPVNQCQVMTLVDLEGCSYEQVAAILDTPVGTVMSRLSRARLAMLSLIEGRNVTPISAGRRHAR